MRLGSHDAHGVENQPSALLDRPGPKGLDEVDRNAQVEGQDVAHGRVHHARAKHIEHHLPRIQARRELVQEQDAEQLRIGVPLKREEGSRIVHVANDGLPRPHRLAFIGQAGARVHAAADPGDAGGGAGLRGAGLEVGEEFEDEEDVGEVVDLRRALVTAGADLVVQDADAGVEEQEIDDRDTGSQRRGEGSDRGVVVHVELHDRDRGVLILRFDVRVRE